MSAKRGLGKGLDALLSQQTGVNTLMSEVSGIGQDALNILPIEFLKPGQYQPRKDMHTEALEELAQSIKTQGIIQPVIVRKVADDNYELIAGERRWRAAQLAALDKIPAIIKEITDDEALAIGLIENLQREDLNPIEEATALRRLVDEFGMTHESIAKMVGRSRTAVTNLLRLLGLNAEIKILVEHGDLEMGHARALLSLDHAQQRKIAQMIVAKDLSVRETERIVKNILSPSNVEKVSRVVDPNIRSLQRNLAEKLGAKINIKHTPKGKGKLIIHYNNLDELDGVLKYFG